LRADTGEFSSLLTRKLDEIGVNGELKYSSRTSLAYNAIRRSQNFPLGTDFTQPDNNIVLLDRDENSYPAALVPKTFPLTSLLIPAEYADYTFPHASLKDGHRTYGGAGFNYESGRTTTHFEAGYSRLNFLAASEKDFRGVVGSFGTDHGLTERWRVAA